MQTVQLPSVAGSFYPADGDDLNTTVMEMLQSARPSLASSAALPKALIVPHAGYIYSGPIAASAYATLGLRAPDITRVVMFAPAHRVAVRGIAAPSVRYFRTPIGDVPIDSSCLDLVTSLPQVTIYDGAFRGEHALEVQLPFLQAVLGQFSLVPFLVGNADGKDVADVIETLWGGDETLIVISSDLSHYLDYESARRMDTNTTHAIETLHPELLEYQHACGSIAIQGLLIAARRHKLTVDTLDQRNSGDTAGPKDRVVGYGAYAFHQ